MDNNINKSLNNDFFSTLKTKLPKLPLKRRSSLDARKARAGYVFVLPFLLGLVLIYFPILIDSFWFSFNDLGTEIVNGTAQFKLTFKGFDHYKAAFATESFTVALLAGLQQLVFEVPAVIVFSLFIAVVLNQKMLGRAAFRAIFFVPVNMTCRAD